MGLSGEGIPKPWGHYQGGPLPDPHNLASLTSGTPALKIIKAMQKFVCEDGPSNNGPRPFMGHVWFETGKLTKCLHLTNNPLNWSVVKNNNNLKEV